MPLLLAIVGRREAPAIKEVVLTAAVQESVQQAFSEQEESFRDGTEVSFDENWRLDAHEIAVTDAAPFTVFDDIRQLTDTAVESLGAHELDEVRGLAMKVDNGDGNGVILVQAFSLSMLLTREGWLSLLADEDGTYSRLERRGFRLADKIVCLVEGGSLKFRSLHTLGRLLDTSTMFMEATDSEVQTFATDNSSLFYISDIEVFMSMTTRSSRKYISSIMRADVLTGHTVQSLQAGMQATGLEVSTRDGKIEIPTRRAGITELMRFLNDGRYVGPVSQRTFITNSRRPAPQG